MNFLLAFACGFATLLPFIILGIRDMQREEEEQRRNGILFNLWCMLEAEKLNFAETPRNVDLRKHPLPALCERKESFLPIKI